MEEKKLEQTNEEVDSKVEHEAKPQEETESLLEPTPYQNKYKRDLVKEEKQQMIANGQGNPHNLYIRTRG